MLEYRILGSIDVRDGDRHVVLQGGQQRALLAALLLHVNNVVSTEDLADALWGEEPPETAEVALRVHVSALRKVLQEPTGNEFGEIIVTRRPGYMLRGDPGSIDARRFESLTLKARRCLEREDPRAAVAALDQSLALWRGEPFAELAKHAFVMAERERLHQVRLGAVETRFEAELALGRQDWLIGEIEGFVATHPTREHARGLLMLALYRAGRQSEALEAYQNARRFLGEELGLDPGPFLKRIEQAILMQDPALEWHPPQAEEERKRISLVVVDLTSFAGASEAIDPEEMEETLAPFHAVVRREIERFGGNVERQPGDTVIGVFGVPTQHEDDPERSVLTALRVVEGIDELNGGAPDLRLAVRLSVATGEALVRQAFSGRGDRLVGEVVDAATRLHRAAPTGGIVVDEATYRATTDRFEYQRMKAEVLGFVRPIWRLTESRSRFGTGWSRPTTPFVGRDRELAILTNAYRTILSDHSIRLVTVTGEPGVGKSRLIGEFFRWVDARPELVFWRQAACPPFGQGGSFAAVGEIVKAEAGILVSDRPAAAASKLRAAVRRAVDEGAERKSFIRALAPLVGVPLAGGASVRREEIAGAVQRLFQALARRDPLVLIFEDLHWGDETLLSFIRQLVADPRGGPILVVGSARPEFVEAHAEWASIPSSVNLPLHPLRDEDIRDLVSALLPERSLPNDILSAVAERACGYPLYAEQIVGMLRDDTTAANELSLPETIRGLLGARLDRLPQGGKVLLENAAVVGHVFWSGAVATLAGIDEDIANSELEHLTELQLIRPVRTSSVRGQPEYAFWHGLLQEVAYARIPRAARTTKHRTVAAWLERMAGDRIADCADVVAYHYLSALSHARTGAVDRDAEELAERARHHLVIAANRAMHMNVGRAETYFRRALGLCPPGHADRAQLLTSTALAAYQAGKLPTAEALFHEALEAFRSEGDVKGEGSTLIRLANVLWAQGQTARRTEILHEAIRLLKRNEPSPELVDAYSAIAFDLASSGRSRYALGWCNKAVVLAEALAVPEQRVRAIGHRGLARCYLGDEGGVADISEALHLALQLGLGRETAVLYNNLAEVVWPIRGPARAAELYRQGALFAERHGIASDAMGIQVSMLGALFELGHWDQLVQLTERLAHWASEEGSDYDRVETLWHRAYVLACRGDRMAEALISELLPAAREVGDPASLTGVLVVSAYMRATGGDPDGAVGFLEEVERVTGTSGGDPGLYRAPHLPEMARLAVGAGDPGLARRLVKSVRVTNRLRRHAVQAAQATLAESRQLLPDAARRYRAVAEAWRDYGFVREHAMALIGEGRCLERLGEPQGRQRMDEGARLLIRLGSTTLS